MVNVFSTKKNQPALLVPTKSYMNTGSPQVIKEAHARIDSSTTTTQSLLEIAKLKTRETNALASPTSSPNVNGATLTYGLKDKAILILLKLGI